MTTRLCEHVKPFSVLISLMFVAGCNTLSGNEPALFTSQPLANHAIAPAPLPRIFVGDKFYYTNGGRDQITAANGDMFEVTNISNRKSHYFRDIFKPRAYIETRTAHITKTTQQTGNAMWPLSPGQQAHYKAQAKSVSKNSGNPRQYTQNWTCEAEGNERIRIQAGTFDTVRVECQRLSTRGTLRQKRTWYFAPELETYVLRRDFYFSRATVRYRELSAIRPSVANDTDTTRAAIARTWQDALENTLSGQKVSWKDDSENISVAVMPLSTFQKADGQYCRTYRQYLTRNAVTRTYGGVACRTGKLKWRTPRTL